jgi:uncharacterized protein (DUF924 family)
LTQNKTKQVNPKTLVQLWTEPKTKVWSKKNQNKDLNLKQNQSWKLTRIVKIFTEK